VQVLAPGQPPPRCDLAGGGADDLAADLDHEAGLLGDVEEGARRQQPAARVLPAHQRLDARDPPGAELDLRLVVHDELAPLEGEPQVALEGQPLVGGLPQRLGPDDGARPALGLGAVHGDVGVAQQRLGVLLQRQPGGAATMPTLADTTSSWPATRTGAASTCCTRSASATAPSSSRPCATTTNSSPPRRATTSPSRQVPASRPATVRSSSSPALWPERVVDDLEAVEVEEQQRHLRPCTSSSSSCWVSAAGWPAR
jgi:hypothetical protein